MEGNSEYGWPEGECFTGEEKTTLAQPPSIMYWTVCGVVIQSDVRATPPGECHFFLIRLWPLQHTYLTSRQNSTWALRLAWQHTSSTVESESLLYAQTSHRPGRWQGRSSWASKTKGETPRSCTTCVSQLPEIRGKRSVELLRRPLHEEDNSGKGTWRAKPF